MHSLGKAPLIAGETSTSSDYNRHNRKSHCLPHSQMWASFQTKTLLNEEVQGSPVVYSELCTVHIPHDHVYRELLLFTMVTTYKRSGYDYTVRILETQNDTIIFQIGIQEDLNHGGLQWSRNLPCSHFSSSRNYSWKRIIVNVD